MSLLKFNTAFTTETVPVTIRGAYINFGDTHTNNSHSNTTVTTRNKRLFPFNEENVFITVARVSERARLGVGCHALHRMCRSVFQLNFR